jgi:hypothetical protein
MADITAGAGEWLDSAVGKRVPRDPSSDRKGRDEDRIGSQIGRDEIDPCQIIGRRFRDELEEKARAGRRR